MKFNYLRRLSARIAHEIEARQRAESALRLAQDAIESSLSAFAFADLDGRLTEVNPAFLALWGYSHTEEVIGQPAVSFWDRPEAAAHVMASLHQTGHWLGELTAQRKDGARFEVHLSASLITDVTGQPVRMMASFVDITQQKAAEDALRRHMQELEALRQVTLDITAELDLDTLLYKLVKSALALLDVGGGGIYLYHPERDVIEWKVNVGPGMAPVGTALRRGEGLSGKVWESGQPLIVDHYARWEGRASVYNAYDWQSVLAVPIHWGDEFLGVINATSETPHTFTEHDADLLSLVAAQAAIAIKNARLFETVHRHADDLETRVADRTAELLAANRQLQQESTERLQVETALDRERDVLQTLMNSSPDSIFFKDRESTFIRINQAHTRILGISDPQQAVGKNDFDFFPPDAAQRFYDEEQQIMRSGQPVIMREWTVPDGKGGEWWLSEHKLPLYDASGEVIGLLGIARDVTRRKQAEDALKAANEQLTVLSHLKDEFVANISHELRTPITNLKLYIHLLDVRPDKRDTYIATLNREAERLEHLIEDIIYISRMDRERIQLLPRPTNLNLLANLYISDRLSLAGQRSLTLTFDGAPNLPPVQADPVMIERVLGILLKNALDYTPAGGQIHVRTEAQTRSGKPWVGLVVSDSGVGITPEELPRLFERFFRGAAALETGTPGSGLGLALVKEIVDRHGGSVEAESVPGQGATFTVWLPCPNAC